MVASMGSWGQSNHHTKDASLCEDFSDLTSPISNHYI